MATKELVKVELEDISIMPINGKIKRPTFSEAQLEKVGQFF